MLIPHIKKKANPPKPSSPGIINDISEPATIPFPREVLEYFVFNVKLPTPKGFSFGKIRLRRSGASEKVY